MVNYNEPNLQEIMFGPIRVGLITQKQFWDHLKKLPFLGPPYHSMGKSQQNKYQPSKVNAQESHPLGGGGHDTNDTPKQGPSFKGFTAAAQQQQQQQRKK
jgi:hypothetical protein